MADVSNHVMTSPSSGARKGSNTSSPDRHWERIAVSEQHIRNS
jgi:hypothetical protein